MGVMKSETIRLHGKNFLRKVMWNRRNEYFFIKLPPYMAATLDKEEVTGTTMPDVIKVWDEAVKIHNKAATTERKIIVYSYGGNVDEKEGRPLKEHKDGSVDDYAEEMEMKAEISFSFWIGKEILVSGEKKYLDINGCQQHVSNSGRFMSERGDVVIDWSPEREQFFRDLLKSLSMAHFKAKKFFKMSKNKILGAIDSRQKLLTFTGGA